MFGKRVLIFAAVLVIILGGCGKKNEVVLEEAVEILSEETTEAEIEGEAVSEETAIGSEEEKEETKGFLVVIDPGHQRYGNSEKEPIGPGASETKAKVTGGTSGVSSGLSEYELNLEISFKLRDVLRERGYRVIMTRESHDVDISNSERAQTANEEGADAFVRIHANGSENSGAQGAMTICQTSSNPFNSEYYGESYKLSECILDSLIEETGAVREGIWETDTMSGINWAMVPSTIVEVGYMTNPEEDLKLKTEEYQNKIAKGIADGVDRFFAE